ncbi:hypothetical protein SAMN02745174_02379 [Cetobacterium ceti]|uniref:Uncharacterized protein n=1 Tax=Cetobacterium ceti TaxID=180163 RepID=A0A1T4QNK9_9FUSO|nr:hypothetical protein [Cetobacterium ceti]SKA04828.1 hypothetical protein SAMN02745174_02379 [Cetobacterium ceti]
MNIETEFLNFLKNDPNLNNHTPNIYLKVLNKFLDSLEKNENKYTGKNKKILNILKNSNSLSYDPITYNISNFSQSIYNKCPFLKEKTIYNLTISEIKSLQDINNDYYKFFNLANKKKL